MKEKGLTQSELAERASITQSTVSKYIRGVQEPKSRELHAISKVLGVSMDSWFGGTISSAVASSAAIGATTGAIPVIAAIASVKRKLREIETAVSELDEIMGIVDDE